MLSVLKSVLIGTLLLWLGLLALVYFFQSRLLYHPTSEINATPARHDIQFEDVFFETSDGVTLNAWYVPARDASITVLFFHGNAGNISDRPLTLKRLHDRGFSVLMVDYRGFGRSGGSVTEQGTYLDARAAWEYLIENKNLKEDSIVIYGRSLGGAVAIELATEVKPHAIIVESSFASLREMAARIYPYLPTRLLLRYDYGSEARIRTIATPTLVAHSQEDELIPFAHGEALFRAAAGPKRFYSLVGSHNRSFVASGEAYIDFVTAFINAPPVD